MDLPPVPSPFVKSNCEVSVLGSQADTIGALTTTLNHEVLDDAVESRSLITVILLASSQGTMIRSALEDLCCIEMVVSYRKFSAVLGTVLP
jgi:hypothetical protein